MPESPSSSTGGLANLLLVSAPSVQHEQPTVDTGRGVLADRESRLTSRETDAGVDRAHPDAITVTSARYRPEFVALVAISAATRRSSTPIWPIPAADSGSTRTRRERCSRGPGALADPARVAGIRPDLPVYLAVGDQDP